MVKIMGLALHKNDAKLNEFAMNVSQQGKPMLEKLTFI